MVDHHKSKEGRPPIQLTSMLIASALDSEQAHTSFGQLPLSVEKSAPIYSFGTGNRDQLQKVYYDEELSGAVGRTAPGPKYDVHDNVNFHQPQNYSFGKDPRVTMGKTQYYDHFSIKETTTDPCKSAIYTKKHYGSTKFGTESRMPPPQLQTSPGPQYNPPHRPEVRSAPKYSLGARRVNPSGSILENQVSTTALVGPNRYYPERSSYTSVHRNISKWSFTKGEKIERPKPPVSKHQTYDTKSLACASQMNSRKKNLPRARIGTATRDQVSKLGTFKDMMSTVPARVRMPHPTF